MIVFKFFRGWRCIDIFKVIGFGYECGVKKIWFYEGLFLLVDVYILGLIMFNVF